MYSETSFHCALLSYFAADLVEETKHKTSALESTYEDFLQRHEKAIDTLDKVLEEANNIYKLANVARVVSSIAAVGGAIDWLRREMQLVYKL